jgi:L-lactate dehydrogenase complex protein LldF
MLLLNRKKAVEEKHSDLAWNGGMKAYEWAFKKRRNLDFINGDIKNKLVKINQNVLGEEKDFPEFSKNSFSKNWKLNLK